MQDCRIAELQEGKEEGKEEGEEGRGRRKGRRKGRACVNDERIKPLGEPALWILLSLAAQPRAVRFTIAECGSVVLGAGREWLCKLTTDAAVRGPTLPDCRLMRPAGVTPQQWAAGLDWIDDGDDCTSTGRAAR